MELELDLAGYKRLAVLLGFVFFFETMVFLKGAQKD